MTETKELAVKNKNLPWVLMGAGIVTLAGAGVLFIASHFVLLSSVLGVVGLGFLFVRSLVRKSLDLTSTQQLIGSFEDYLEQIKKQVGPTKYLEFVEKDGEKLSAFSVQLISQYKMLKKILQQKFEPTEITFTRYMDALESASRSIAENLLFIKNLLESVNVMKDQKSELKDSQKIQVSELFQTLDQAFQDLGKLYASLNGITTKENERNELEESLAQIQQLADRAQNYSRK